MLSEIDILNRQEFIDKIISTVEYHSKNNLKTSFSVQGEWGCGKSWILDRVFENLYDIQDEKIAGGRYCVFRYNAWKYDYYDEPLVSLLISLKEQFDSEKSIFLKTPKAHENYDAVKLMIKKTLLDSFESFQESFLFDIIDSQIFHIPKCVCFPITIKKRFEYYKEKVKEKIRHYDPYYDLNKLMNSMIDGLNKISAEKTIVIIIDELDRCLPEHAVKVLERMHHISQNVNNIQFIYGIDKTQIESNVEQIFFPYGFNTDDPQKNKIANKLRINQYLSKFISFGLQVPQAGYTDDIKNKYPSLFEPFAQTNTCSFDVVAKIKIIASVVNPRTLEQIIHKIILTNGILNQNNEKLDNSILVFELFCAVAIEDGFDFANTHIKHDVQNRILKLDNWLGQNSLTINAFNNLIFPNPIIYDYSSAPNHNILGTDFEEHEERAVIESSIVFYYEGIKRQNQFKFYSNKINSEMTKNLDYLKQFCSYYKSLDM